MNPGKQEAWKTTKLVGKTVFVTGDSNGIGRTSSFVVDCLSECVEVVTV